MLVQVYIPAASMESLRSVLEEKLEEYCQTFTQMNLVLFEDAVLHVTRICRVIDLPGGNALLVGVGGSGKQSLSRLACFISKLDTFQIVVSQHYDAAAFKLDMQVRGLRSAICFFWISVPPRLSVISRHFLSLCLPFYSSVSCLVCLLSRLSDPFLCVPYRVCLCVSSLVCPPLISLSRLSCVCLLP